MKFILEVWPDLDDPTPEDLLEWALESIQSNPELSWTIVGDDGKVIGDDVRRPFPSRDLGDGGPADIERGKHEVGED